MSRKEQQQWLQDLLMTTDSEFSESEEERCEHQTLGEYFGIDQAPSDLQPTEVAKANRHASVTLQQATVEVSDNQASQR